MRWMPLSPVFGLWVVFLFLTTGMTAMAQSLDFAHIEVTGTGEVRVVPDIVNLDLAVAETGTDLVATKQIVDRNAAEVIGKARELGIADNDINATRLMILPQYQWDGQKRIFQGYRVSQEIGLRLRDTARYAELLSALVNAGISELTNTTLETSRRDELQNEALVQAVMDARDKAERIAGQIGMALDQVFSVTEVSTGNGPIMPMARAETMAAAGGPQSVFEPGSLGISRTVRVVFRLGAAP